MLGGGKLVELELVPVFEEMIQDVELVQMGVIKYLAEFLKMLSEPCRVSYLPLLHDILHSTNPFNWRLRQSLSVQLPALLALPPAQSVYTTLFPLVMTLLQDPVACVRRDSFKGAAKMVALLHAHAEAAASAAASAAAAAASAAAASAASASAVAQQQFDAVIRSINSLARGEAFNARQLWAELCVHLLCDLDQQLFERHFVDGLLALTSDPVLNVRVAVAAALSGWAGAGLPAPWEAASPALAAAAATSSSSSTSAPAPAPAPTSSATTTASKKEGEGEGEGEAGEGTSSPTSSPSHPWAYLLARPDIRECVRRLACDDADVHSRMALLRPAFPDVEFGARSCKGLKGAPGGSAPVVNSQTGRAGSEALPSLLTDADSAHDSVDLSLAVSLGSPSPIKRNSGDLTGIVVVKPGSPSSSSSSTSSSSSPTQLLDADEGVFAFGQGAGAGAGISRVASGSPPLSESPILADLTADATSASERALDDDRNVSDNVLPGPDAPINTGTVPMAAGLAELTAELEASGLGDRLSS